jgi:prepilin-type N-terminal cleavage/methylation domain-containing protein
MSAKRTQSGFTLVEMLIAMILLGLAVSVTVQASGAALQFFNRLETDQRLKELRMSLMEAYRQNSTFVESNTGAWFTTSEGTVSPSQPNGSGYCVNTTETSFNALGRYLSTSPSLIFKDGHGMPFCVFITPQQTSNVNGQDLTFHSVAIVSGGRDGVVEGATRFSDVGILSTAGDDQGVVIDGRALVTERYFETVNRIRRIADAYQAYFQNQYLANSSRDASVDYFANTDRSGNASALFDGSGIAASSRGAAVTMSSIGLDIALGLSQTDVTDAYGQLILVDNSSNAVRSPDNSTLALQIPPFTARISTLLPNGTVISQSVIGAN